MSWLFSFWTVFVCVVFLGVVAWTLKGARHEEFERAARMPLDEDDDPHMEDLRRG